MHYEMKIPRKVKIIIISTIIIMSVRLPFQGIFKDILLVGNLKKGCFR